MFAGFGVTCPSPLPLTQVYYPLPAPLLPNGSTTRKRPAACRSGAFEGLGHFCNLLVQVDKDEHQVFASLV